MKFKFPRRGTKTGEPGDGNESRPELVGEPKLQGPASGWWHPERTPECPPITAYEGGVSRGWGPKFLAHVRTCPFCKKSSAMQWNVSPPLPEVVRRHFLDGTLPDDKLLHQFLDPELYPRYAKIIKLFELAEWAPARAEAFAAGPVEILSDDSDPGGSAEPAVEHRMATLIPAEKGVASIEVPVDVISMGPFAESDGTAGLRMKIRVKPNDVPKICELAVSILLPGLDPIKPRSGGKVIPDNKPGETFEFVLPRGCSGEGLRIQLAENEEPWSAAWPWSDSDRSGEYERPPAGAGAWAARWARLWV